MRYKPGKKEETRKVMINAASQCFREYGFAGVGVDGLAKAAGVTSGAFYSHFGSKNSAFELGLIAGLDEAIETIPQFQEDHGKDWVKAFIDHYMGKAHREDLAGGCVMAALTAEVVRANDQTKQVFEDKMAVIAGLIAKGLAGGTPRVRTERAWAFLGVLTGGLNMARSMNGDTAVKAITQGVKRAAIEAAGEVA